MTAIVFRQPEAAHPLQEICPWLDFVTDSLILTKDGSLLAGFAYTGEDPDDLDGDKTGVLAERMRHAFSLFDSRVTAWWIVDKRTERRYPQATFENETAARLDAIYAAPFVAGEHYAMTYTLYLLFTPASGTDRFMDRVARYQAEEGASLPGAIFSAMKAALSGEKAFFRDVVFLRDRAAEFERLVASFASVAPLRLSRLKENGLAVALSSILNRASAPVTAVKPKMALMDAWAPLDYVAAGADTIRFVGTQKTVCAAVLGIKKWPEETTPLLLETLFSLDCEMTLVEVVRFLDALESSAAISRACEFYELSRYNLFSHAAAKLTGAVPQANADSEELLALAEEAKSRVGVEGMNYAMMALSVMVYAENERGVERAVARVAQKLSLARFGVVRERMNALPAFCAMLPGQWAMQSRYDLVSLENVADLAPLCTVSEGSPVHGFFSEDVYHRRVGAFAVFANRYGGYYHFSPHVGQVGHMVVIAPTGGGKTTFVNFCLSQFQRYGRVRTYVFDRNQSCEIVTALHGGTHIDLRQSMHLNPFFALEDGTESGRAWVREFILRRLAEGGYRASAADRLEIDSAILVMCQSGRDWRMSRLATLLSTHLETELSEWLDGRPYGMFDHATDDFALADWTTVEMQEIMAVDRLARAFMDYAFRKIFNSLDGTPTFIYLEEASFLLANPVFRDMIDDWLKTFRKKNAFVWMSLQSPEAITNQAISASILDNVFSFLLLPNERVEAHREAYKKSFGLMDHQVDLIRQLVPRRDYLLVQGGQAHVIKAAFSPEVLAFVRSEASVLSRYRKIRAEYGPNWAGPYLAAMSGEKGFGGHAMNEHTKNGPQAPA